MCGDKEYKTYWLETYGCEMNKAESSALEIDLEHKGYKPAISPENADMVILNTCSVRQTAEERVYGRLGLFSALKKKKNFHLAVTGCMAERLGEKLKEQAPAIDSIIGMNNKNRIPLFLPSGNGTGFTDTEEEGEYGFYKLHGDADGFRSFVPIMHGCDNFCSYCIVPIVRGREKSRPIDDILYEIDYCMGRGVKEITLLGQNVNSYRYKEKESAANAITFAALIERIGKEYRGGLWIRFLTSHPKDFSDEILFALKENPLFCRHIHLPVQHGSNRMLSAMNRKYTREFYEERVSAIRKALPGVTLSTDIMVGFPGETEDDFNELLCLMESVGYLEAFTYYYNPREGTKAWELGDIVLRDVKMRRLNETIALQKKITHNLKKSGLGAVVKVLVEGISKKTDSELIGRTEGNEMVVFPGPKTLVGNFVELKLLSLKGNTYIGESTT